MKDGFEFEAYPNRNSLPYIELYGLQGVRTMLRGTLRNPGWCVDAQGHRRPRRAQGRQRQDRHRRPDPAAWLRGYVPGSGDLRADTAARLGLKPGDPVVERFAWLGLFDEKPIGIAQGSNLDILAKQMLDRMAYKPGERDMIVLHHEFLAEFPGKPSQRIFSTLIDFGIPNGDSSMARTVSLPAAIGVKMILQGTLKLTGVQIPVVPEIYEPVLAELARLGIECKERTEPAS